ncbi:nuclease-related domain-containing protein [Streptomyces sp. NPDC001691]|uniref:nuclease-related domain-containing protein n=1 Tax=unclassified Streptomyces TaxID=2593676 RepID=UPI000DE8F7CD|nr:nuclease-related domain-containing protein [Streptomyces sp. SDr-06]RCH61670.1 NERD domain-containing protein [Streptomyces sp. SDr-06]
MAGLRVTPVHRHGQARLYVSLPDGRSVAWYDRDTGRVSLLLDDHRDEVLAALRPYAVGELVVGPPPVPTSADLVRLSLHPDDDLAPNRPGEALIAELERGEPQRRFRTDPRRGELAAQQLAGAALDRLEAVGWRVLHSVPLPGRARIDHLAVGPAGVLTVRSLSARRHRVRVADPLVTVGRAAPLPHLRAARHEAERASLALAAAVRPVLVLVGAERVELGPPGVRDVRVLTDGELPDLARLGGVLKPADVESLYWTARDRRTWSRV